MRFRVNSRSVDIPRPCRVASKHVRETVILCSRSIPKREGHNLVRFVLVYRYNTVYHGAYTTLRGSIYTHGDAGRGHDCLKM